MTGYEGNIERFSGFAQDYDRYRFTPPEALKDIPETLRNYHLELSADGVELTYHYDTKGEHTGITALLGALHQTGIRFNDLRTKQSSLEEIFVGLVHQPR